MENNIVEITIAGKAAKLSCNENNRVHIINLAEKLSTRVAKISPNKSITDSNLLFTILTLNLEDEIANLEKKTNTAFMHAKLQDMQKKIDSLISKLKVIKGSS